MVTLISFFIVLLGAFNWFSIGLMQYDFVAGVFGTQSSFLSRATYIVVGFAAIWIIIMAIVQKGKIKINENGFKKDPLKAEKRPKLQPAEYSDEFHNYKKNNDNYDEYDYADTNNRDQTYERYRDRSPFE